MVYTENIKTTVAFLEFHVKLCVFKKYYNILLKYTERASYGLA